MIIQSENFQKSNNLFNIVESYALIMLLVMRQQQKPDPKSKPERTQLK